MSRSRSIEIETPEGVRFSLLLAGPLARFVAWMIDACVVVAISQVLGQALSLTRLISADIAQASSLILYFALSIGYGIALEWRWRGQTLGKRLLRLRPCRTRAPHPRLASGSGSPPG